MIALLALARAAEPLVVYDLQVDDGGFVAGGDLAQWRWGEVRHGPGAGWDGATAWSTGLDADYLNDAVEYLEIPLPALDAAARPALSFMHWYDLGAGDAAWIELDTGNGFVAVEPLWGYPTTAGFAGASDGWWQVVVALPAGAPEARARLAFSADAAYVAEGWTVDAVAVWDGDVAAPHLEGLSALPDTENLDGPYVVNVTAMDDVRVASVTLWWSVQGGEEETAVAMADCGDGTWTGEIPGQAAGAEVRYRVEATDGDNAAALPASGTVGFRVALPAPTALVGPEGRIVATEAQLSWTPPDSAHAVLGYEIYRGGMPLASTEAPEAEVPLLGANDVFSVRARYEAGVGDPSNEVVVDAVVPDLTSLSPAEAWPGEALRVTLHGEWTLLREGAVIVGLGADVVVDTVSVVDVDTAVLDVRVTDGAAAGPRDLVLTTPEYALQVEDAFDVLDADGRPRLVAISPEGVEQGDRGVLAVRFVGELAGTPEISLPEGVVVEGVTVDGDTVSVAYACAPDAPLGADDVVVDDGVRRLEGVRLTVEDHNPAPATTCGPPAAPGLLGVAGAALLAVRRRRGTL